jgi:hypothetical protein
MSMVRSIEMRYLWLEQKPVLLRIASFVALSRSQPRLIDRGQPAKWLRLKERKDRKKERGKERKKAVKKERERETAAER